MRAGESEREDAGVPYLPVSIYVSIFLIARTRISHSKCCVHAWFILIDIYVMDISSTVTISFPSALFWIIYLEILPMYFLFFFTLNLMDWKIG